MMDVKRMTRSQAKQGNDTLIYSGPGWDAEFLRELTYDNYICFDSLPGTPHYSPGEPGWYFTKDAGTFLCTLQESYGPYTKIGKNTLQFQKYNLTYHINCDASQMMEVPMGDILIRGYMCKSKAWERAYMEKSRKVIVGCNTVIGSYLSCLKVKDTHVCLCGKDCFDYSSDDDDDDDDDDDLIYIS